MNKDELIASATAKSDQIDADNLVGGITMDVTIKAVQRGPSNEQPLQLVLEETEKFYRPSKTYRRALIGCFGDEPANWIGKRIRLIRNPETMFGGVKVGGLEVSHASIADPIMLMLSVKRGKKTAVKIDVMPVARPHARGTVTGDKAEGDLDDVLPMKTIEEQIKKMLNSFSGIGMNRDAVEFEFKKPISEWDEQDMADSREVFRSCKIDYDLRMSAERKLQQEI